MQRALQNAVLVPMNLAVTVNSLWPNLLELAKISNISCKSDLQVYRLLRVNVSTHVTRCLPVHAIAVCGCIYLVGGLSRNYGLRVLKVRLGLRHNAMLWLLDLICPNYSGSLTKSTDCYR